MNDPLANFQAFIKAKENICRFCYNVDILSFLFLLECDLGSQEESAVILNVILGKGEEVGVCQDAVDRAEAMLTNYYNYLFLYGDPQ